MPTPPGRPEPGEHAPSYDGYVRRVTADDVVGALEAQEETTAALFAGLSPQRARHRYAPGKWSVQEVLGHLMDTERVMAYRALRIARGDGTPLAGFEENAYVAAADFDARPLEALLEEYRAVRRATVLFFRGLSGEAWTRRGVANGVEVTVRALAYIIAGHELHHGELLRTRYLGAEEPSSGDSGGGTRTRDA
jgi:uncharacterized damage-inducible protein DinB